MVVREITIEAYHAALRSGELSVSEAVQHYLRRCRAIDSTLKSIICINPLIERLAKEYDEKLKEILDKEETFPPLFGVPVVVKDTYATEDMPTTAGCKSLAGFQTLKDAPVVSKIRAAGGIIFAKANLHELSCQGVTLSSLGGQTLNPYDLTRTPGGSSGGTAAALSANLAMVGCGGDTMNSLRSPASACNIVGFRPTPRTISTTGTVPVSWSQDTIGPMGRTVGDVKKLFSVMKDSRPESKTSYKSNIIERGLRIGVLENYFESSSGAAEENQQVRKVITEALEQLVTQMNAKLIPFNEATWGITSHLFKLDVQRHEFLSNLDNFFIQNPGNLISLGFEPPEMKPVLAQILQKNEFDTTALPPRSMLHLATDNASDKEAGHKHKTKLHGINHLKVALSSKFLGLNVDVLAFPHQTQLVVKTGNSTQPNRNGLLASLTGHPAICIPAGFSEPTEDAPDGVPIGLELLGRQGKDEDLLDIAEAVESVLRCRREPRISQDTS